MNWDYISQLDFSAIWQYRGILLRSLCVSVIYLLLSTSLGGLLGLLLSVVVRAKFAPVRYGVGALVEACRNTPLLVLLFWVHFALPSLTGIRTSTVQSGAIAVTLTSAAYYSEVFRAGIGSIPRAQWEGARALGFSSWTIWVRVVLPQAFRIVIPSLSNTTLGLWKGTAILSVLSVPELLSVTARINNYTGRPLEIYTVAAALYLLVGYGVVLLFRLAEWRPNALSRLQVRLTVRERSSDV